MEKLTRRSALKRFGVLAGSVGLPSSVLAGVLQGPRGGGGRPVAGSQPGPARVVAGTAQLFVVYGSGLHTVGRPARTAGDQEMARGDLAVQEDGHAVGSFLSMSTLVDAPSHLRPSVGFLAVHTFSLPGGTIVGTGVVGHDGSGAMAVTGGTGTFHGARGSYRVSHMEGSLGAGRAVYTFSLLAPEVSDG